MRKIKDLLNLSGKRAIVTGGLGHIGFAITDTLLELGAEVIVTVTENELENKIVSDKFEYLKKEYGKISAEKIDFLNDKTIEKFFSRIKDADILVNNAYSGISKKLEDTTFEDFNRDLNGTVSSVFKMAKLFSEGGNGRVIINIASMYGIVSPDWRVYEGTNFNSSPSYGTAKAGVIQLTKYLATYLAKKGIRVNSISPGPFPKKEVTEADEKFHDSLKNKTMLGRIGEPEDLKGVIALLASDASSYITGQNFIVDGGWTSW